MGLLQLWCCPLDLWPRGTEADTGQLESRGTGVEETGRDTGHPVVQGGTAGWWCKLWWAGLLGAAGPLPFRLPCKKENQ